jgi:hypothetical protein
VKVSLSACYLPAWAAVVNFLVGQTHWKMGKQTVEDAKKRWSAGFAASEVNPSPNRLGLQQHVSVKLFLTVFLNELSFILIISTIHISSVM